MDLRELKKRAKVNWWRPVAKKPHIWEIWTLKTKFDDVELNVSRPVLLYSSISIKGKKWFVAFPISSDIDWAGRGDPVFTGDKEGLGYPFLVELYNVVLIPEWLLGLRIGMLDEEGRQEVEKFLNNRTWERENLSEIINFRLKEMRIMAPYRERVPFKIQIIVFIDRIIKFLRLASQSQVNNVHHNEKLMFPSKGGMLPVFISSFRSSNQKIKPSLDVYLRRLAKVLEEIKKEESDKLNSVREVLVYLYLYLGFKKKAEGMVKEIEESGEKTQKFKKFLSSPEKHRDEIKRRLERTLSRLHTLLKNDV